MQAQVKPKPYESRRNFFFFFFLPEGGRARCLSAYFDDVLSPSLSTQTFRKLHRERRQRETFTSDFGRQTRGDQECPFGGVTSYGRIWRKGAGKRGVERDSGSSGPLFNDLFNADSSAERHCGDGHCRRWEREGDEADVEWTATL